MKKYIFSTDRLLYVVLNCEWCLEKRISLHFHYKANPPVFQGGIVILGGWRYFWSISSTSLCNSGIISLLSNSLNSTP